MLLQFALQDIGQLTDVEPPPARGAGLRLYYREERLGGVVVSARLGPQVLAGGVALAGQVPSVLEQWLLDRAEARQDGLECEYMDPARAPTASRPTFRCP